MFTLPDWKVIERFGYVGFVSYTSNQGTPWEGTKYQIKYNPDNHSIGAALHSSGNLKYMQRVWKKFKATH